MVFVAALPEGPAVGLLGYLGSGEEDDPPKSVARALRLADKDILLGVLTCF